MAHQLARIADDTAGVTQRDGGVFYKDRCLNLLYAIDKKEIPAVIIVDGLDEAVGWDIDQSLLQCPSEGVVRILVSARTLAGDQDGALGWLHRLDWNQGSRRAQCLLVPPLERDGIGEALESMGYPVAGLASRVDILGALEHLTQGDPLLVRMYAESLWSRGEVSQRLMPEELQELDSGYGGFFKVWFEKQSGNWVDPNSPFRKRLEAVLAVLSVALGPIEQRHIETICNDIFDGQAYSLSAKDIEPIERFLLGDGFDIGFSFQHPKFAQYFEHEYFRGGSIILQAQRSIINWLKRTVRGLHADAAQLETVPDYVLEHCVQHLAASKNDPETLDSLLSEGWQRAWFRKDGGYIRYSADIAALMDTISKLPGFGPGQRWVMRVRCGLILSSIRSLGVNTPAELLVGLVRHKKMSSRQALHRLRFQPWDALADGLP
jgi:hypothetical protein